MICRERITHWKKDDTLEKKDYSKKTNVGEKKICKERLIHWRKDDTFEKKNTSKGKRRSEGKITHCRKKNTPKKG